MFAIGIPNIGKETADDLMARISGTLEALMGATEQELVDIEDVGEIVASSCPLRSISRMKKTAASSIVWLEARVHPQTHMQEDAGTLFEAGSAFGAHRNAADAFARTSTGNDS